MSRDNYGCSLPNVLSDVLGTNNNLKSTETSEINVLTIAERSLNLIENSINDIFNFCIPVAAATLLTISILIIVISYFNGFLNLQPFLYSVQK